MPMTPYPEGLYPEQLPAWLSYVATYTGHRPPDTTRPFTYVDLGCGTGLTACWVKRCYPHATVVGLDADAEHIRRSRAHAEAMSVDVQFHQARFEDPVDLPRADFVVLHGVWSWVTAASRRTVVRLLGTLCAHGGLVYVDYNALPGRAEDVALARLLRQLVPNGEAGPAALVQAFETLGELTATGHFAHRPEVVSQHLAALQAHPGYLVHEFLSADWAPALLAEVADQLSVADLAYLGSTHLSETVEGLRTTAAEAESLERFTDLVQRHTFRDVLRNTAFRHDVFARGPAPLDAHERVGELLDRHYALALEPTACTAAVAQYPGATLPSAALDLVQELDGPPRTGRYLAQRLPRAEAELAELLGLLCAAGYVYPSDKQLFSGDVDDLMARPVALLPVLSPSGLELTFDPFDRALWRAKGDLSVARALLQEEGRPCSLVELRAALDAFQAAHPAMQRAGWP